jgi:hypothetical protein
VIIASGLAGGLTPSASAAARRENFIFFVHTACFL